jgi:hypothetical protein
MSRQVLATLGRQAAGETDLILLGGNYWAALFWSYLLVRGERSFSKASSIISVIGLLLSCCYAGSTGVATENLTLLLRKVDRVDLLPEALKLCLDLQLHS